MPKSIMRTGARHPLPNLSGCLGTRGTRSNEGPAQEVVILTKFDEDRTKIVDFLLIVKFWASPIFFDSYFTLNFC